MYTSIIAHVHVHLAIGLASEDSVPIWEANPCTCNMPVWVHYNKNVHTHALHIFACVVCMLLFMWMVGGCGIVGGTTGFVPTCRPKALCPTLNCLGLEFHEEIGLWRICCPGAIGIVIADFQSSLHSHAHGSRLWQNLLAKRMLQEGGEIPPSTISIVAPWLCQFVHFYGGDGYHGDVWGSPLLV